MGNAIVTCGEPVKVRGDGLGETWWQGRQWAVTSDGIERRDGLYLIGAHRLWEHASSDSWSWPQHLAAKNWIDVHDFCTAFVIALTLHPRPVKAKAFKRGRVRQACQDAINLAQRYGHPKRSTQA
jgi:hypothetical protein